MSFTQEESNEVEICVSCGAQTSFKKSDNITWFDTKIVANEYLEPVTSIQSSRVLNDVIQLSH